MTERPILFNCDMVRAMSRGQKTQTRRPIMPQPVIHPDAPKPFGEWTHKGQKIQWGPGAFPTLHFARHCPFGQPGDRLWVRETFFKYWPTPGRTNPAALYKADGITLCDRDSEGMKQRWTPAIHMPRELSRITLEITALTVEPLCSIEDDDAILEGVSGDGNPMRLFRKMWDSIYAKRGLGWRANPWVWVVKFKRVEEQCNQG